MPTLRRLSKRCLKFTTAIVVLIIFPAAMRIARAERAQVEVQEVYEVQLSEFTDRFTFPEVKSFDLSPDGKTLAVEFYVGDRGKSVGIWVVLWDVDAGRLVSSKRLEVRSRRDIGYLPRFGFGIRFSHDGKMLLVLTGPQLVGLSLPGLEIQYTIEPLRRGRRELFITHFAMASHARRIAVVHQALRKGPVIHDARILNMDTGETIQGWRSQGRGVRPMALSPDGNFVGLYIAGDNPNSPPRGKAKLSIFHTKTGELQQTLITDSNVGGILFLGSGDRIVTIPPMTIGFGSCKEDNTIGIWDVSRGRRVRELRYPRWGVRGRMLISRDGTRIGALTECTTRGVLRTGWGIKYIRRFLIWDVSDGKLLYASQNLKGKRLGPFVGALIRLSADGKRLAVGGARIVVYEIREKPQMASSR